MAATANMRQNAKKAEADQLFRFHRFSLDSFLPG
jgi:hypothetical protein